MNNRYGKLNAKSEKIYWEGVYSNKKVEPRKLTIVKTFTNRLIFYYKKLLNNQNNYSKYVFLKICQKYLKNDSNKKIMEIGCAPGDRLIFFNKHFGV